MNSLSLLTPADVQSFETNSFPVVLNALSPDLLASGRREARLLADAEVPKQRAASITDDPSYNRRGEPDIDFVA